MHTWKMYVVYDSYNMGIYMSRAWCGCDSSNRNIRKLSHRPPLIGKDEMEGGICYFAITLSPMLSMLCNTRID